MLARVGGGGKPKSLLHNHRGPRVKRCARHPAWQCGIAAMRSGAPYMMIVASGNPKFVVHLFACQVLLA